VVIAVAAVIHAFIAIVCIAPLQEGLRLVRGVPNLSTTKWNQLKLREECVRKGSRKWAEHQRCCCRCGGWCWGEGLHGPGHASVVPRRRGAGRVGCSRRNSHRIWLTLWGRRRQALHRKTSDIQTFNEDSLSADWEEEQW